MTLPRIGFFLAALAPAVAAAEECGAKFGSGRMRAESGRYAVVFRTVPAQVAVGRAFALDAEVCAKGADAPPTGLRVDAHMPAHRHGMNYRPTIVAEGEGRFRADGLFFHMPGRWQFVFDVEAAGTRERITQDVMLE